MEIQQIVERAGKADLRLVRFLYCDNSREGNQCEQAGE